MIIDIFDEYNNEDELESKKRVLSESKDWDNLLEKLPDISSLEYLKLVTQVHQFFKFYLQSISDPTYIHGKFKIQKFSLFFSLFLIDENYHSQEIKEILKALKGVRISKNNNYFDEILPLDKQELTNFFELKKFQPSFEVFHNDYLTYLFACLDQKRELFVGPIFFQSLNKKINPSDVLNELITFQGRKTGVLEELKEKIENIIKDDDIKKTSIFPISSLKKESTISIKEQIENLKRQEIPVLDFSDIQSVINFGNELSFHSDTIYNELPKLKLTDSIENSVSTVSMSVNSLSQKPNFLVNLLNIFLNTIGRKNSDFENQAVINKLADLKEKISLSILKITEELTKYDYLRQYMETYQEKCEIYLQIIEDEYLKLSAKIDQLKQEPDSNYFELLNMSRFLKICEDKKKRFILSDQLIKQEIVQLHQNMLTHFVSLNTLEITKNDLLPLITSELLISTGNKTKNQALDLSKNVFQLLQSLLNQNIAETEMLIERLKNSDTGNEVYQLLKKDVETYLNYYEKTSNTLTINSDSLPGIIIDNNSKVMTKILK